MSKLIEKTPLHLRCGHASPTCPAVFEDADGQNAIIGRQVSLEDYPELAGRIGPGEIVIEVPAELLEKKP